MTQLTVNRVKAKNQPGEAGQDPGDHALETEVTLEELADMLGEELELPHRA